MLRRVPSLLLLGAALVLPVAARTAPPAVPSKLSYQGVLLDPGGQPETGNVDLTVRVYDALVGGTLVYLQTFPGVPLSDGVFTVEIGPTGSPNDVPSNPLTTDFASALVGDVGATGPSRFLEVTVGAEDPLARSQILTVPYALHASTSDSAALATLASEVVTLNGVDPEFVAQLFQHIDYDGGAPPNDHPDEGVADSDGDGVANFLDPDNDNDGIPDVDEFAAGTALNLVTPTITDTSTSGAFGAPVSATVVGTNFDPTMSVTVDGLVETPLSLVPTGFDLQLGALEQGVYGLLVTLANGESAAASLFRDVSLPAGGGVAFSGARQLVGSGVTLTDFDLPAGTSSVQSFPFPDPGYASKTVRAGPGGMLAGLRCFQVGTDCRVELVVDLDSDNQLEDAEATTVELLVHTSIAALIHGPALALEPGTGHLLGAYRSHSVAGRLVRFFRDADGDLTISPGEFQLIETAPGANNNITNFSPTALRTDSADRVAVVYNTFQAPGGSGDRVLRAAWDRSGDGDFDDTVTGSPEVFTVRATGGAFAPFSAAFDASDALVVVYGLAGTDDSFVSRDLNADGDFADAGEFVSIPALDNKGAGLTFFGGMAVLVGNTDGEQGSPVGLSVLVDLDLDGNFAEPGEIFLIAPASTGSPPGLALEDPSDGLRIVVAGDRIYPYPTTP